MKRYESVLSDKPLMKILPDAKTAEVRQIVVDTIYSITEKNYGAEKLNELKKLGLNKLHKVIPTTDLPVLRKTLEKELILTLLQWASYICKKELDFDDKFFLDHKVYFRINYPYEEGLKGPKPNLNYNKASFKKIISKTYHKDFSGAVKDLKSIIFTDNDPVYNLVKYNQGKPQEAWAHGPHIDTWYGHSYDAINFWWSITGVNEENSMVVYPESHKINFPFNPAHMYLEDHIKTPEPEKLVMEDGELLIFDPEMLHGTRINTSDETRLVVTIRACPVEPSFSDKTKHALYNIWYRSEDIQKGELNKVRIGKVVPDRNAPDWDGGELKNINYDSELKSNANLGFITNFPKNTLTQVTFNNRKVLVSNIDDKFYVTQANCSHVGAPLAVGSIVDGKI